MERFDDVKKQAEQDAAEVKEFIDTVLVPMLVRDAIKDIQEERRSGEAGAKDGDE